MVARKAYSLDALERWLKPLDEAALECDGFSRAASGLLQREGVPHRMFIGTLGVEDVGHIGWHMYLQLPCGAVCDFRARIWLGADEAVPHGLFVPPPHAHYTPEVELAVAPISAVLFTVLTGQQLADYPALVP